MSLESPLKTLKKKASQNNVEPEDLFAFALAGDVRAVPMIRELAKKYSWPATNFIRGQHVGPTGRWAEVVCIYLEGGCDALVEYARPGKRRSFRFATAILEELKSAPTILAAAELAEEVQRSLPKRIDDAQALR